MSLTTLLVQSESHHSQKHMHMHICRYAHMHAHMHAEDVLGRMCALGLDTSTLPRRRPIPAWTRDSADSGTGWS